MVHDLDTMREIVGDEKITFHGINAGTRIGYCCATMHPDKVRAMALDGNINPSGDFTDHALDFNNKRAGSMTKAFRSGDRILSQK